MSDATHRCAETGAITIRDGAVRSACAPPGAPPYMFASAFFDDGVLAVVYRVPYGKEARRNFAACSGGEQCA